MKTNLPYTLSRWSQLLLGTYYYATLPQRMRVLRAACRAGRAPVMVLFYHRVADQFPNAWTMPYGRFLRQLRWLQGNFELISLEEAVRRIAAGVNHRAAVSITFDDGYAENYSRALPLLVREGIPVTYFVASRNVIRQQPFPHDVTAGQPLAPNTCEQLKALADAGVEIGAHTRSHADLALLTDDQQLKEEIAGCRDDLQQRLGRPVRFFSFPYGLYANLSERAFRVAREAGYTAVCSAYGGYNFPGDDAFHLQRIHADPEMIRFKNWLTVDPRKLAATRRYAYGHQPLAVASVGSR